jgi:Flp pilus assembly protein TadB
MAIPLLFSICSTLMLCMLRESLRLGGGVKAASAADWWITASVVLLPVVMMTALAIVAPGYLQSMASGSAGRWSLGGAILAQIAVNFSIKKIIDFSITRIVDPKV